MKVMDESNSNTVKVVCECGYYVLWEDSSVSSAGKRKKIVWVDLRELNIKKPLYIKLRGQIKEADYCGDVDLLYGSVQCRLIYKDREVEADEHIKDKLSGLLCNMWEPLPKLVDDP